MALCAGLHVTRLEMTVVKVGHPICFLWLFLESPEELPTDSEGIHSGGVSKRCTGVCHCVLLHQCCAILFLRIPFALWGAASWEFFAHIWTSSPFLRENSRKQRLQWPCRSLLLNHCVQWKNICTIYLSFKPRGKGLKERYRWNSHLTVMGSVWFSWPLSIPGAPTIKGSEWLRCGCSGAPNLVGKIVRM